MPELEPLSQLIIEPAVRAALQEDLGRAGDVTTEATVPATKTAHAVIAARASGRIAGLDVARCAFCLIDPSLKIAVALHDGADAKPDDAICHIEGNARSILSAERVALNFMGQMSGIATATAAFVKAIEGTGAKITCTRKTTPNLRAFEKYSVRAGGGVNHRFGLDDGILIKDNHIAVAGGVRAALDAAKARAGHMLRIEIEVDTLDQLKEALDGGAHAVLLDNMDPDTLKKAVEINKGRATLEASGGITLETVRAKAETGVDLLSVGWLTHSAPSLDLGLDIVFD
jgi:nicotinate-nucleotide pyrophosphorylase (carboxylating)